MNSISNFVVVMVALCLFANIGLTVLSFSAFGCFVYPLRIDTPFRERRKKHYFVCLLFSHFVCM